MQVHARAIVLGKFLYRTFDSVNCLTWHYLRDMVRICDQFASNAPEVEYYLAQSRFVPVAYRVYIELDDILLAKIISFRQYLNFFDHSIYQVNLELGAIFFNRPKFTTTQIRFFFYGEKEV